MNIRNNGICVTSSLNPFWEIKKEKKKFTRLFIQVLYYYYLVCVYYVKYKLLWMNFVCLIGFKIGIFVSLDKFTYPRPIHTISFTIYIFSFVIFTWLDFLNGKYIRASFKWTWWRGYVYFKLFKYFSFFIYFISMKNDALNYTKLIHIKFSGKCLQLH